jgi:hypothetical protein
VTDTVRIRDYSDLDLLGIMADLAKANGTPGEAVDSRDVAARCFGTKDEESLTYYTKCVTARFTWMAFFGLVEKAEQTRLWYISDEGNALRRGSIGRTAQTIDNMPDVAALALAHVVGQRFLEAGDVAATAMRRELVFQIERRRRQSA